MLQSGVFLVLLPLMSCFEFCFLVGAVNQDSLILSPAVFMKLDNWIYLFFLMFRSELQQRQN